MRNQLARRAPRVGHTKAKNHVIETRLEQLQKSLARYTPFAEGILENPAKLPFQQTILVAELLFFTQCDRIIRLLAARPFWPVHSGRIILSLECLGWPEQRHTVAATDFGF